MKALYESLSAAAGHALWFDMVWQLLPFVIVLGALAQLLILMRGGRRISLILGYGFLYLPILVLIIFSFNEPERVAVWVGFTTKWYAHILGDGGRQLKDAALVSLQVGLISSSIAVVFGVMAALTLVRVRRFWGRQVFTGLIYAPLIMPEVITGLMLLVAFQLLLIDRGFWTVVLAHTTFAVAYVAVVVQARLQTFDRDLEAAARDLGAGPFMAFIKVTLPLIAPGVIGGWLLAFTLSLDDVVITQFTKGEGVNTAAVYTFSQVKTQTKTWVNAFSTLLIGVVAVGVFLSYLISQYGKPKAQK